MTLNFDVLFEDLFRHELQPFPCSHGSCFKPSRVKNNLGSLSIFLAQAQSMNGLTGMAASQAAWKVAYQMNGLQGKARGGQSVMCNAVQKAVGNCIPSDPRRFAVAVDQVAQDAAHMGFGRQRSAASKMLQVYDDFLDVAVIYDDVVKRALGPDEVGKYVDEFELQFTQPHIKTKTSKITMLEFFKDPLVVSEMRKVPIKLTNFIMRRSFDRVLWLMQKAKDQSGSCVLGLCESPTSLQTAVLAP